MKPKSLPELSLEESAEAAGVAVSTVHAWCDKDGLPSERKGRKRLIAGKALIRFLAHRKVDGGSERQRLAKEQADRLALENETSRGELVQTAQVQGVLMEAVSSLASGLDGMAGRMANELAGISDPAEIRARLLEQIRIERAGFADVLTQLAESPGNFEEAGAPGAAAEEEDAERVGERKPGPAPRKRRARGVQE